MASEPPDGGDVRLGSTNRSYSWTAYGHCAGGGTLNALIHFYHVTKKFDRYSTALHDVTFHIEKGEFVFLTGASGAGKSTLLKLILRQITPTEGQIVVNGRNLASMKPKHLPFFRRDIGMVFQDFKLIERMTVFENLSFILTVLKVPPKEHTRQAYAALRAVNLSQKLNAYQLQL